MQTYTTQSDVEAALISLADQDEGMARAFEKYGTPPLRRRKDGFAGLIGLLISQQVSTKAAQAIQARFDAQFPKPQPEHLLAASDERLAACGISRPKQRYLRHLASAIMARDVDLKALRGADDAAVFDKLTSLLGIGPWTADCYLLFNLGRCDRFPAGDLALQEGYRLLYCLNERPDATRLTELAQRWQPHRAAAARMLWTFYNGELGKA
ncbi:DNA-3-methyladenine glycosylase 2 family protein [Alphaproteobacteria bacterium]|nr:DNA-3-methyladenine glycosylase 2 family protein [Alphaproteobacteria bacterium]